MIVATAGHIDHGKTSLVKALTGVDTDRLPQEKARGISIDLGFAYWRPPNGALVGFVDVPGHERFVRNMLAGVCATDMVLLVVAADDGVMPQTLEHLHIVDLLGVRHGIVVITKCDRVDEARVRQVAHESRSVIATSSSLVGAQIVEVSSATGAGIEALRQTLAVLAAATQRTRMAGRRFRFAVDRAFTVAGSGTVVTGTVFDGSVQRGDRVIVSPNGHTARVRGVHKDNVQSARAEAGERCGINLAGLNLAHVQRGDWIVVPHLHAPAELLDVRLRVLASERQALRHWTPVHLHLGTRDVSARVALRRGQSIEAGEEGFARLIPDHPLPALHGDRFILRDQSARRTLGGGSVLDAFPVKRRLPPSKWEQRMRILSLPAPSEVLQALVGESKGGVLAEAFARNYNLDAGRLERVLKDAGLATVGTGSAMVVVTSEFAKSLTFKAKPEPYIENTEHVRLWQLAHPVLRSAGRSGMKLADLAAAIHANESILRNMLFFKVDSGQTVRVGENRFYLRDTIDEFVSVAIALANATSDGRFTAASFRDASGIGRTRAIEVLEALDRLGATRRVGDTRVLRNHQSNIAHQQERTHS